jgi:hypothetical protein
VRVSQPLDRPGHVVVYLASDAGVVAPTDVELVLANIKANAAPPGLPPPEVESATPYPITVHAVVHLRTGSTAVPADVAALALEALTAYFAALPIGGTVLEPGSLGSLGSLFLDMLIATIVNASDQIVQAVITNIPNDLVMAPNQVAVLTSTIGDFEVRS